MAHPVFRGSITALVTPFRDGALDEGAFRALVERQIAGGTHGLVPVGTTGESVTLNLDEHKRIVELCVETARGRVPVIAGAGANDTTKAVELVRFAKTVGADAALVVTPYYNKPSQEGLYRHYAGDQRGGAAAGHPLRRALRTGVTFAVETVRAGELPNVIGHQGRDRRTSPRRRCCARRWARTSSGFRATTHRARLPGHGGGRLHQRQLQRGAEACAPSTTRSWRRHRPPSTGRSG
jgi:4-hydroxy-tetrahydrodipicolinate synthase